MRIVDTSTSTPSDFHNQWERDQIYNGLDCCVTAELLDVLLPQLDTHTAATYAFSKALQGPVIEMKLRGVLIDKARKQEVIDDFFEKIEFLNRNLDRIVLDGVGLPGFNWRSNADLQSLFYDKLRIPIIKKGGRPTVNREALEKMGAYTVAKPIVAHIMAMRDLGKKISMLQTSVDPDGRIRTSYNIAGTSTGRFSSSFSEFGTGGNLQNVEESLRSIFIADKGMKLAKFDAKSGESYAVGGIEWNLFQDDKYLKVCETGDPHTAAARFCWPGLPWTGDLKKDKEIAEQPFYRQHSYRNSTKKMGHATNYNGKAPTISEMHRIPISVVADFQRTYFTAFPAHLQWHAYVDNTLRKHGNLVSLTGRKRYFFGRRNDDATLREAIAYDPQCSLAEIVNHAMLNIWRAGTASLYMHDHDALTFQYPEEQEDEIIPKLLKQLEYPVELKHGRQLLIPYDCKVGWNRGDWSENNTDGLKDYTGKDKRRRSPEVNILDRRFR